MCAAARTVVSKSSTAVPAHRMMFCWSEDAFPMRSMETEMTARNGCCSITATRMVASGGESMSGFSRAYGMMSHASQKKGRSSSKTNVPGLESTCRGGLTRLSIRLWLSRGSVAVVVVAAAAAHQIGAHVYHQLTSSAVRSQYSPQRASGHSPARYRLQACPLGCDCCARQRRSRSAAGAHRAAKSAHLRPC